MTPRPRVVSAGTRAAVASLDSAAIRAAAESHPRLRAFLRTVAEHSEGGDRRAHALLEFIMRRVIEDVGELHAGNALRRLERIQVLRDNIAAILDNVLEARELPPGVRVETLGEYFDQLSTEMRELSGPRDQILGDGPAHLYPDSTDYAAGLLHEFDGLPLTEGAPHPGGRHAEPRAALADAFGALPPARQALLRRAVALEGELVTRTIFSDEARSRAALAELESRLAGRLSATELAELRAALADLGRARSRGLQISPIQLAEALARITDVELRAVVEASGDVWIMQHLAVSNPQQLAEMWNSFRRTPGRTDYSPSAFRGYLRHQMVTFGRAAPAEYTAAFSLSSIELFLKGPDAQPNVAGTDLVGIGHDGWTWLIDDKSHRTSSVDDVSALTDSLVPNLRSDAAAFETALADLRGRDPGFAPDPRVEDSISRMRQAADDIDAIPATAADRPARIRAVLDQHRLRLRVTSAMGEVVDISDALRDLGLDVERTGRTVPLPRRGR